MASKQWGHGFNTGKNEGELEGYCKRMTDEHKESGELYMSFVLPNMIGSIAQKIIDDILKNNEVTPEAHLLAKAIERILASSC